MTRNRASATDSLEPSVSEPPLPHDGTDHLVVNEGGAAGTQLRAQQGGSEIPDGNTPRSRRYRRLVSLMLSPVTDDKGYGLPIVAGLSTLFTVGMILGVILPKNQNLPTTWYRLVSASIGYIYFICWSVSFYPQVMTNFRRRTTSGLSADFCGLNVLGFACYSTYNAAFFFSPAIHKMYKDRYGVDAEITVQSNDVAFAVHAFVLASVTLFQIGYYDGFRSQRPSPIIEVIVLCLVVVILAYPITILLGVKRSNWLDYLYLLSFVKILVTLVKYVPQVYLNYKRKCTSGWSIWQILLDFTGGVLSLLQLVFDCMDLNDWSAFGGGNLAKFFLGLTSIVFDLFFMIQHYVLYPDRRHPEPLDVIAERDEGDPTETLISRS